MAAFEVLYKPSTEKDLLHVPRATLARVLAAIKRLADNPFPRQALKLKGTERLYRLRVGSYRIIYRVDTTAKRIVVEYIRHRREVYRKT